jgi:hypothetical protein
MRQRTAPRGDRKISPIGSAAVGFTTAMASDRVEGSDRDADTKRGQRNFAVDVRRCRAERLPLPRLKSLQWRKPKALSLPTLSPFLTLLRHVIGVEARAYSGPPHGSAEPFCGRLSEVDRGENAVAPPRR